MTGAIDIQNKSGQLAVVIPITILITAGVMSFSSYFKQTLISGSYATSRSEVELVTYGIFQNIKDLLVVDSPAGCPIDLSSFRDFTQPSAAFEQNYEINAASLPPNCLVNPTNDPELNIIISKRVKTIFVSINTLTSPRLDDLSSSVSISVSVVGRPKQSSSGKIESMGATSSLTKRFQMQVAKTSFFNVIFTGQGSGPLIDPGNASVQFEGAVLLASNTPYLMSNISSNSLVSGVPQSDSVSFHKTFYTIANGLKMMGSTADTSISESELKQAFQGGISTSLLKTPSSVGMTLPIPPYEVNAWQIKYDFGWGMPLPDLSSYQAPWVSFAGTGRAFDSSRANFNTLPNSFVPTIKNTLDDTCPSVTTSGSYKTPAIYRYDSTFTLDFTSSSSFCGLIAAKQLVIKTGANPSAVYQLIGNFIVDQISVQGSGTVIFYNPAENPSLRQGLGSAATTTTAYLNGVFAEMASGYGRPFFTPWIRNNIAVAKTQTKLWPQRPVVGNNAISGLLEYCQYVGAPANSACFKSSASIDNAERSNLWKYNLKPAFFILDAL